MTKSFYENVIADAKSFDELKLIHRFLVCDLQIQGKTNDYIRKLIANKESFILLNSVCKVPEVRV